jgi:hypothetical protein
MEAMAGTGGCARELGGWIASTTSAMKNNPKDIPTYRIFVLLKKG